jgi:hypothetical protein
MVCFCMSVRSCWFGEQTKPIVHFDRCHHSSLLDLVHPIPTPKRKLLRLLAGGALPTARQRSGPPENCAV